MNYISSFILLLIISMSHHLFAEEKSSDASYTLITDSAERAELVQKHAALIQKGIKSFGSREHASEGYVEHGFNALAENKLELATQRFNEAWLLDNNNANVYLGQGLVFNTKEQYCLASDNLKLANTKGLNEAGFLADYAKILSYCATNESPTNHKDLITQSNTLYTEAHERALNDAYTAYIYISQAESFYTQQNYTAAKQALTQGEALGGKITPELKANILESK